MRARMTRRAAMGVGLGIACVGAGLRRGTRAAGAEMEIKIEIEDDAEALEAARARLLEAGLRAGDVERSAHFQALGDAPREFLAAAARLCEGILKDYLAHFRVKGFGVEAPSKRLTLVIFSRREAFARFLGEDPGEEVPGVYEPEGNRLAMFDNRTREEAFGAGAGTGAGAGRVNAFVLTHEALHQLTFNTGLVERGGDAPLCVLEGLAMYGETRPPRGGALGRTNVPRLRGLAVGRAAGVPWFAIERLLTDDSLLEDPATQQSAYAQSWVFTHHLMSARNRTEGFRKYLERIKGRRDGSERLSDARGTLGDLEALDRTLRREADRMLRTAR